MPQHCWVKLHELKIAQSKTRTQRKRMTVSCDCGRVRRTCEYLAISTGCNHHRWSFHQPNTFNISLRIKFCNSHAGNASSATRRLSKHQVQSKRVVHYFNTSVNGIHVERALYFCTRLISAGMHNSGTRMPTFTCECSQTITTRVECCTEFL